MFDATEVVPINFVFFTASAIVAGMSTENPSGLFKTCFCAFRLQLAVQNLEFWFFMNWNTSVSRGHLVRRSLYSI